MRWRHPKLVFTRVNSIVCKWCSHTGSIPCYSVSVTLQDNEPGRQGAGEKKRGRAHVVLEEDSEKNVLLLCLANCMKMCGPPKIPRIRAVSRAVSNTIIIVVVSGAKWRLQLGTGVYVYAEVVKNNTRTKTLELGRSHRHHWSNNTHTYTHTRDRWKNFVA